ncbi:hypothetical protein K435DRAFT_827325 [Dendrothele bispora CBS 962.96]|uniref:Fruit-body specific protein a n=1 Tax=Dendrothele bispora (strain CBS 962.96) TaxID=1314807 RepID=A0A4S8MKP7_DENBC|nr:hypothetical protein K435DRAFT_827325 [Dendrothele bispora CBS 962.96]
MVRLCTERLLALLPFFISLGECSLVYPAFGGIPASIAGTVDHNESLTDSSVIISTAHVVDQKGGATEDFPPNLPPPPVRVTALDGDLTNITLETMTLAGKRQTSSTRRFATDYVNLFNGTGTGPSDRDGSIEGTAYLTYTVVDNSTYNIEACLDFCDQVEQCVFANLYYEFNNPLLDWVFSEGSNLKCAVYADIHNASEKLNRGGQQLEPPPAGLTFIQESSGWAAKSLVDPNTPDGYELVFGPTNGANDAPGYMGFAFIDRYDVQACADLCNTRDPDSQGGGCQFFNIWRAVVNGVPTTYTCSMYFLVADESTAVNFGQGDLIVTQSRGYRRKSVVPDGSFEGFTCGDDLFCFTSSYSAWEGISPPYGNFDASIFHFAPYAHTGTGAALLGSAYGEDDLPGTLMPSSKLQTEAGKTYTLQFFHNSAYSSIEDEADAFVKVDWNGVDIATIRPGFSNWTFYSFDVIAQGNDVLQFHGGKAPAFSFIDDVNLFLTVG